RQLIDQMARVEGIERYSRKIRQHLIEIDRLPILIQRAVFADLEIDPIQRQIPTDRQAPVFPMRQSAAARADIEQPCPPWQRFKELKPRMRLPEQLNEPVARDGQPALQRCELGRQSTEIARRFGPRYG